MPSRYGMNRDALSPAEMARSGTMSEAIRRQNMGMSHGGTVIDGYDYGKKKKQGAYDKEDESIAMRKKKKRTKKQLKASKDESYGKWGKRGKDWKKKGKA